MSSRNPFSPSRSHLPTQSPTILSTLWESFIAEGIKPALPLLHVRLAPDRLSYLKLSVALHWAQTPKLPLRLPVPTPSVLRAHPGRLLDGRFDADFIDLASLPGDCAKLNDADSPQALAIADSFAKVGAAAGPELEGKRLNPEQRLFIAACLGRTSGDRPLILFGPPGTGKTFCLVETALAVLREQPDAKLLLCAPSNLSTLPADLLCAGVASAGIQPGDMIRVNDPRSPPANSLQSILRFCLLNKELNVFKPPKEAQIAKARVVVASCTACQFLHALGRAQFTHVMIDEAGQATLPEALLALTLLAPGGQAVLSGDPMQLGPTLRSPAASARGLAVSLLQSCIEHAEHAIAKFPPEQLWNPPGATGAVGPFLPHYVQLCRNYRSNQSLLDLPSRLYYAGKLVAEGNASEQLRPEGLDAWRELGIEGLPEGVHAAFLGVRGEQKREADAPSYMNLIEATTVVDLVTRLVRHGSFPSAGPSAPTARVMPEDVGIISIYRKQCYVIRQLLRDQGLGAVRVGTIDDFQGQEQRIVVISTVLSRPESLPMAGSGSTDGNVGFWRNPRRFNVAITRARALMIVVGSPTVLSEDPSWRQLLGFIGARGTWFGAGREEVADRFSRQSHWTNAGAGGASQSGQESDDALALALQPGGRFSSAMGSAGSDSDVLDMECLVTSLLSEMTLGAGGESDMFPESLEEQYRAYSDEIEFRVPL